MASRGLNKVMFIGYLGSDPDIRYMPNGDAVANFSLATSESWKDKNTGQPVERTEWHRLVTFRKTAEIAGQYLKKGSRIYAEGSLRTRQWEKEGVKQYTTEIVVTSFQMLDKREGNGDDAQQRAPTTSRPAPSTGAQPAAEYPPGFDDGFDTDSIPF